MMFKSMGRAVVRSFIVRIYRATPGRPDSLLGEAEEVGVGEKRPFKTMDELWGILNRRRRKKPETGGKGETPGDSSP